MAKPSIYRQISAVPVVGRELKESPRHWNCGLIRYKEKLWMAYRYHVKEAAGRCATAIVELNQKTFQPMGVSQHLALSGPTGTEHHEDARLFIFRGEVHLSYTEMRGYKPGVDYTCVMRYAKLKLRGNRWLVVDVFQPRWSSNDGRAKEKNWVFFECDEQLHAVYSGSPQHVVVRLDGERVEERFMSEGPRWSWGSVRGGTPPIRMPDGTFLSVFHSSLPTEVPPHFVRYYGAAYTFEGKAPFTPLKISARPVMSGSEEDGHQVDPRYVEGWKPYVVFPCGLVDNGSEYLVSFGVNDWQCAVGKVKLEQFQLIAADGTERKKRYFRRENGSMPVKIVDAEQRVKFVPWLQPRSSGVTVGAGFMECDDPREAQEVAESHGVVEIEEVQFQKETRQRVTAML